MTMLAAKARAGDQEQLKAMFETPEAMYRLEAGAMRGQVAIAI